MIKNENSPLLIYVGKKICFLISYFIIFVGCQKSPTTLNSQEHPFQSILKCNQVSQWNELFAHTDEKYLTYIYSETCMHCLSIKNQIDEFACESIIPLYFIEYSEDIPIGSNVEETIGATNVESCFIKGTPSLILIENGAIAFNIAGTEIILETINLYKN